VLTKSGLVEEIGSDNVLDSLDAALQRARDIVAMRPTTDTHATAGVP